MSNSKNKINTNKNKISEKSEEKNIGNNINKSDDNKDKEYNIKSTELYNKEKINKIVGINTNKNKKQKNNFNYTNKNNIINNNKNTNKNNDNEEKENIKNDINNNININEDHEKNSLVYETKDNKILKESLDKFSNISKIDKPEENLDSKNAELSPINNNFKNISQNEQSNKINQDQMSNLDKTVLSDSFSMSKTILGPKTFSFLSNGNNVGINLNPNNSNPIQI